ncbi:MAG: hypothetical protein EBZ60_08285, partial [Betaproteobacteria bacterium]|nr:hypothetical protein [Betaproteobacteria bacterium]
MVCTRRVVFHARSKRFQHADDTDCDGGDWRANAVQWLQPLVARLDLQLIDGLCNRPVQGRTCFREHCALPQTIYDGDPVDCKPVHADIFVGNVYGHPRVIAGIRLGDKTHPVRRADASALPILAITLPDRTTAITNECGHHTQDIFARLRPRRQTVLDRWIVRTARRMESTFQPCSQSAASQQTRLWSMRHWTECTNCCSVTVVIRMDICLIIIAMSLQLQSLCSSLYNNKPLLQNTFTSMKTKHVYSDGWTNNNGI